MNKRWFLLLALLGLFAFVYGYPQIALAFAAFFVVSGLVFLIDRWSEQRTGKKLITIRRERPAEPK